MNAHPTAERTAQQLREAFPFDQIPRYLLRDRDGIIERVIGTVRGECLDHVIVFNEASLYRHVKSFVGYYHESRTHLSLAKDAPEPRPVQAPQLGRIAAVPQVGGLHHRVRTARGVTRSESRAVSPEHLCAARPFLIARARKRHVQLWIAGQRALNP